MHTPQKTTETTETETLGLIKIHLKSNKSTSYDIIKAISLKMSTLEKAPKISNYCSQRCQKSCSNPSFWCFSLCLAHIYVVQNFSIPTSFGRKHVALWPILLQKVGVTMA